VRTRRLLVTGVFGLGWIAVMLWFLGADQLPTVGASTFTVTRTDDAYDGTCDVDCSLREAIVAANHNAEDDTITLGAGTFVLTQAVLGDLDIASSYALTIAGVGPDLTIIDASAITDRVFELHEGVGTVVITGVAVVSGTVSGYGGGIYNHDADLVLINSIVSNNTVTGTEGYGGGVFVEAGTVTLNDTQVRGNAATVDGGGVFVGATGALFQNSGTAVSDNVADRGGGIFSGFGRVTIGGGEVLNNTAGDGGGLFISRGAGTMSGGLIADNSAGRGGGVFVGESTASFTQSGGAISSNEATNGGGLFVNFGQATLSGGEITDNTAADYGGGVLVDRDSARFVQSGVSTISGNDADYGGGVFISFGRATLSAGQISGNTAAANGGGVFVSEDGGVFTQTIGTSIAENTADHGGGVAVGTGEAVLSGGQIVSNTARVAGGGVYNNAGLLTMSNTTVSNNDSEIGGGGVYNRSSAELDFVTVVNNNSLITGGDGIQNEVGTGGTFTLRNSIIALNGSLNCVGAFASGGHNIENSDTCDLASASDQPSTDPVIGPLANNGGSTLTHALLPGSPAVDRAMCDPGVTADQRGEPRPNPVSAFCDVGAYESDLTGEADVSILKEAVPSSAAPGETISFVLEFTNAGPAGAAGVVITDLVPYLTNTTVSTVGPLIVQVPGESYVWQVEDLPVDAEGTITITGQLIVGLPASSTFSNVATIDMTSLDSNPGNDSDEVEVTVTNVAPVASDATLSTAEDTPLDGSLTSSDLNGEADIAAYGIVVDPSHGSVILPDPATGDFTYTPLLNYVGTDSFTYIVTDTGGLSDTGVVTVNVTAVNDPPVAANDSATTLEDTPVTIDVLANDTDPDGSLVPSSVHVTSEPANGSTAVNGTTGAIAYTPDPDWNGTESRLHQRHCRQRPARSRRR
jgi:CSLREA domain-containing protein/uncharacterized repeat protein (TIGR01451 family)